MTKIAQTTTHAACPRCGYDQRGVIDSWRETCPLDGTCAECGLRFSWSEVLRPELHEPRWCVEYAPRRRFWLPPVRRTLLRVIWPWWFWRSLKMSHQIRPWRIIVFAGMLLGTLLLLFMLEQTIVAIRVHQLYRQQAARQMAAMAPVLRAQIRQNEQQIAQLESPRISPPGAYEPMIRQLRAMNAQLRARATATPWKTDYASAIAEAVLTPLGGFSRVAGAPGRPYPPPGVLHLVLLDRSFARGRIRRTFPLHAGQQLLVGGGAGLLLLTMLPASFVLLPISRRRAKVRWRHIARVTAYSLVLPAIMIAVLLLTVIVSALAIRGQRTVFGMGLTAATWASVPLVLAWWTAAIGSYLRIPHAWAVTITLSIMNLLLAGAVLWLVRPELALLLYDRLIETFASLSML